MGPLKKIEMILSRGHILKSIKDRNFETCVSWKGLIREVFCEILEKKLLLFPLVKYWAFKKNRNET